jgi:hypothetical protein
MSQSEAKTLMAALAAVFAPSEVKFKPGVISGNRALALPYVDCRVIQDRLDYVLGIDGWQDQYTPLPDGSVVCELRCRIGGEWIVKTDVGGSSEQPDGGDRVKAAYSDALKRVAVHVGVARYLHAVPNQWLPWDPKARKFLQEPQLPAAWRPVANSSKPSTNGISDKQWAALVALCKARGFKPSALLTHFGVDKPRQIRAEQFAVATALVEKTRA